LSNNTGNKNNCFSHIKCEPDEKMFDWTGAADETDGTSPSESGTVNSNRLSLFFYEEMSFKI
jgi:hypothetical protein